MKLAIYTTCKFLPSSKSRISLILISNDDSSGLDDFHSVWMLAYLIDSRPLILMRTICHIRTFFLFVLVIALLFARTLEGNPS